MRPWFKRQRLALLTDLYELTMMAGYLQDGRAEQTVCFDYFFRTLPPNAGFAVSAGLEPFLDYLENLQFYEDDLDYLATLRIFDTEFFDYLRDFKPRVFVKAVPEGTLVFPFEPVVHVEGTLFDAQLIETALLNFLNHQTLIASKAARICLAANGDPIMEFGLRRAHGPDGGISGSRAAYIGGCTATSNVLAGKVYGIPVSGTHAHSWVMSFDSECDAFRAFARHYPDHCVLLVDTYDTENSGIPNAIKVFQELEADGKPMRPAIRLDSGDLARLSKIAYRMMTEAGLSNPLIVASNDLDEDLIADLKRQGAKINAWGVGTHLITAGDHPSHDGVYKLVAVQEGEAWKPRMKISSNIDKATDPDRKQVVRYYNDAGNPVGDVMYLQSEVLSEGPCVTGRHRLFTEQSVSLQSTSNAVQLLQPVFDHGKRIGKSPTLEEVRDRAKSEIDALPDEYKRMRNPEIYKVLLSDELAELKRKMLANPHPA